MLLHPSYRNCATADQSQRHAPLPRDARWQDARGFTLIELLIVCLIVSILAAIAIPMFLGPQENAVSAQAKSLAGSAATAVEAYAADNQGSYEGLTPSALHQQEPDIDVTKSTSDAFISRAKGTNSGYTLTAKATNGDEFTITDTTGEMKRTCVSTLTPTGCAGAKTSTW
ncbi:MAG TPA: type II secretion system protein [Solirubrobacteraceae bacterium]|nr:type II secretion system protein [Solirubrobacteraceae bacterium]